MRQCNANQLLGVQDTNGWRAVGHQEIWMSEGRPPAGAERASCDSYGFEPDSLARYGKQFAHCCFPSKTKGVLFERQLASQLHVFDVLTLCALQIALCTE